MNCATCGSTAISSYLHGDVGEILRCRACAAVFISPEQQDKAVESLYGREYFDERDQYFFHDGVVDGSGHESPHIADFRAGLARVEAHVGGPGTLLDVGCATGSFLSLARARGWQCRGVEVSAFAAARAREQSGCEVICGRLEDAPYPEQSFDAVTMWDLLEHLPEPVVGLEVARRLLKPRGVLLVNTPNERALLRRIARAMYRASGGLITAPVDRLYHRYHLHYFARGPLGVLFRRAGFEVLEMDTKPIPLSRGRISTAARIAIRAISLAERLLHAEYEIIVIARNPAGEALRPAHEAVAVA